MTDKKSFIFKNVTGEQICLSRLIQRFDRASAQVPKSYQLEQWNWFGPKCDAFLIIDTLATRASYSYGIAPQILSKCIRLMCPDNISLHLIRGTGLALFTPVGGCIFKSSKQLK